MAPGGDGRVAAAVVNRGFKGLDGGLGVYLRYDPTTLPVYLEWRMMGEGLYAVGMEPATNGFKTIPELIDAGFPIMIEPGEERVYQLEFGVLAGGAEIDAFAGSARRTPEANLMAEIVIPRSASGWTRRSSSSLAEAAGRRRRRGRAGGRDRDRQGDDGARQPCRRHARPASLRARRGRRGRRTVAVVLTDGLVAPARASAAGPPSRRRQTGSTETAPPARGAGIEGERRPHTSARERAASRGGRPSRCRCSPPADRFRELIAAKVSESWREIPHFAVTREVDAEPMVAALAELRAAGTIPCRR